MQSSTAPYVPFRTFLSAIESLERGVPNQVDRSVWPSHSGATQGQLLGAFRFLGLVEESGAPTAALRELAESPGSRRARLRKLLERSYPDLVALDLAKASPRQVEEAIRRYGLSGATHRKAVTFFLQAATYAELRLSPLLRRKTRQGGTRRRKEAGARSPAPPAETAPRESKTVRLRSGGTLTLVLEVKVTELGQEDREFLFRLLDDLSSYERGPSGAG